MQLQSFGRLFVSFGKMFAVHSEASCLHCVGRHQTGRLCKNFRNYATVIWHQNYYEKRWIRFQRNRQRRVWFSDEVLRKQTSEVGEQWTRKWHRCHFKCKCCCVISFRILVAPEEPGKHQPKRWHNFLQTKVSSTWTSEVLMMKWMSTMMMKKTAKRKKRKSTKKKRSTKRTKIRILIQ